VLTARRLLGARGASLRLRRAPRRRRRRARPVRAASRGLRHRMGFGTSEA
jgi:hypothetical protein